MGLGVGVVAEQGRVLATRLPQGHPWSFTEQLATSAMHVGAEAQERSVLLANGGDVLIADGTTATPVVWHLCAVANRPGYDAGPAQVTDELLAAVDPSAYDLILLLAPDLEWVADGVRDDPFGRDEAFTVYQRLLPSAVVVRGPARMSDAMRSVSAALPTAGGPA